MGKYIKELKSGLEQEGHTVHILARNGDEYHIIRGNRQYPLKMKKLDRRNASFLSSRWGMGNQVQLYFKKIRDESTKFLQAVQAIDLSQYQIIHAQDIVSASVLRVYKPSVIPLVLTVHGCVTAEYYYYGYIRPHSPEMKILSSFESGVIQQCEQTIVPSKWLLGVYEKCEISTQNMKIISNGINIPRFDAQMNAQTGLKSPSNKTIIICTGRLEKVKGQHTLLDALARLKKIRKDWVCWIVGRGEAKRELQKKSKRLGIDDSVKFLGRRYDVPALLKQAHIFVIPSLEENYPYSLVEAQIAGKAIVASQTGGITEMVKHDVNGLLFPAGNSKKLYEEVKRLFKDPDLQKRLGNEAKAWGSQQFSLDTMTKQVIDIYNNALESNTNTVNKGTD
nr:glycosyltransferase family 4 protein [Cohnella sp. WQ 127256]